MSYILNTWTQEKGHQFDVVEQLPVGDNWIELDGDTFMIYASPDIPAFGRSFFADLWAQSLAFSNEAFDELWAKLHGGTDDH